MISIIVPVYNCEKYLEECLKSILQQSFTDWEMIIVDDGSTDSSGEIADSYAASDSRISVLHINNGGLSWARNQGIKESKGDWLCFVDSDDALFPNSLSILYENAIEYEADISMGGMIVGNEFPSSFNKKRNICSVYDPVEAVNDILYQKRLYTSAWGKIYKRSLFDKMCFTEGLLYEDLDLIYRLCLESKKIVYTPVQIYFYRCTPGSILNTWNNRRLDVLKITDEIEKYAEDHRPEILKAAKDRKLSANFNMFINCWNNCMKEKARECWGVVKKYRIGSLFDSKVRIKNKTGILLSFLGSNLFVRIAGFIYK